MTGTKTLVVGVGSPHGDDQAGWMVVERLGLDPGDQSDVAVRKAATPADLLNWIDEVKQLIICDAVGGAGPSGSISRWTWPTDRLVRDGSGTHDFCLPDVLRLADRIGKLPEQVTIYGIEIANRQPLASISPEVLRSIGTVASEIHQLLRGAASCTNRG